MRIGVVTFPGSNGDHDALAAVELGLHQEAIAIWHKDHELGDVDALLVPGGFSWGDYLRAGAIARFAPVMDAVIEFAEAGYPVLGICNGFQILTEAGLLPGALLKNSGLTFSCRWVHVRVETDRTPFTHGIDPGTVLRLPIAHGQGRYFAPPEIVSDLEKNDQIIFRYTDRHGVENDDANPNGSLRNIAGVSNRAGNVVGLMPHPERAYDAALGGDDGLQILGAMLRSRMAVAAK
ncbi:MAG: phosphoribosylformylglycinamidine synthase I [Chloroflexi bacterium]|nr:MAG: phosphoribosylformylglycinamidine synthase I [Chloroflexota bacterium]